MAGSDDALAVLLVEDNPGDAKLVQHHLRRGSFPDVPERKDITHVERLSAALDAVESSAFDIVLLDLDLPETTAAETLDRFLPEVPGVPVVILTGLDDEETAVEAIREGAQDYLPKDDLDTGELMRALRYAIERKKQELALREQSEQLLFFNSVLRHDVGNGMEVIRRNAQLLEDETDDGVAEKAETIRDWSDDLVDLTEKVRRMLRSVAGDDRSDLQGVDLAAMLRDRIEGVESMDEAASVDAAIPDRVTVRADDMLADVLGNLLQNAIEHNDAETPQVAVTVSETAETVRIEIADNGPGIPDGAKESIFGWGETRRSSDGGFGLYFVQTMVDNYGGSVEVRDNDPRGSVFSLTLERAGPDNAFA